MSVLYVIPDAMDSPPDFNMQIKLILLAHGSRDNNWCQTFENGLKTINKCLNHDATLAYMEMAAPSLENVVNTYYLQGVKKIRVLPLFFAAGRHLLHDVPEQISDLQSSLEGLEIELLKNVGEYEDFWHYLGDLISKECSTDNLLSSNQ
jgi:sirohydrochlorin cobaltochelatase